MATGISCEDAVEGSCAHFDEGGGGANHGFDVTWWTEDPIVCSIDDPGSNVDCTLAVSACPDPATDPDGHNEPGIALCDGCDDSESAFTGTINQAKCCLIHGQTTNPDTGGAFC